jgi:hypothetical protein
VVIGRMRGAWFEHCVVVGWDLWSWALAGLLSYPRGGSEDSAFRREKSENKNALRGGMIGFTGVGG